jgi:hypothetical protein
VTLGQGPLTAVVTPPASPARQQSPETVEDGVHATATQQDGLPTPPPSPRRHERASGMLSRPNRWNSQSHYDPRSQPLLRNGLADPSVPGQVNVHIHSFRHSAAVKAIAFAPWQPNLLATGGGSNDRRIHFFHTGSGATLALINVFSQVTSLVWSTTRREIVATFGYSQPEHEIRIAVFSWPSCECVVRIP